MLLKTSSNNLKNLVKSRLPRISRKSFFLQKFWSNRLTGAKTVLSDYQKGGRTEELCVVHFTCIFQNGKMSLVDKFIV